jgi:hypothetical protein
MTMAMRSVAVFLAGLALAVAPPAALAKSGDVAATQALARATDTLVRTASPDIGKGLAAVKSYSEEIATKCPRAAVGSPQDHDSEQLDDEVIGALTVVGYHAAAAPIAVFARSVEGLHWSNQRLTHAVRTFATKLAGLSRLTPPNLCGDVEAWVASGYQTLPPGTSQFSQSYLAVDPEAEEVPLILRLVTPYEGPGDIATLHRVDRFEARLGEAEAHAVEYYSHLMDSIDLNQ